MLMMEILVPIPISMNRIQSLLWLTIMLTMITMMTMTIFLPLVIKIKTELEVNCFCLAQPLMIKSIKRVLEQRKIYFQGDI